MKKTSLFLALLVATVSTIGMAQASCWSDCGNQLTGFIVTLDLYTLTTEAGQPDERAVYIQQIHEDAAAYLTDGTETALLDEAFKNTEVALQTQGKTAATETQIAAALINLK